MIAVALLLAVFSGLEGCKKQEVQAPVEQVKKYAIEKEYQRGPVSFKLQAGKQEMTIAERLHLALDVSAKEDIEVELPEFGDKLDQFGIKDYQAPPPKLLAAGQVQYRKEYELEPFLSGEYTIPAMKVLFRQKGGEESWQEIESEPLTIAVKSLLPGSGAAAEIKDIIGPVELPGAAAGWWYALAAGLLCCGAGAAGYMVWRQRRRQEEGPVIQRTPDEIAFARLEALLAEALLASGEVKEFYLRLSAILRQYIEDRFGLRAPERTTEEFLFDLKSTDVLTASHKGLLQEFLQHCDLVKFARHRPENREIQQAFDSCKHFIAETAHSSKLQASGRLASGAAKELSHAV